MDAAVRLLVTLGLVALSGVSPARAGTQPTAILHAHDEPLRSVATYVCRLPAQGYSHVQITPVQRSNPGPQWWKRYQPIDHLTIEGRGSAGDLRALTRTAHGCGMKVIADVVLNHMASDPRFASLAFPGLSAADFHRRCTIDYSDGNPRTERDCWLNGDLPDLDQSRPAVMERLKRHLRMLVDLGVDGFRFDAAKHIDPGQLQELVMYVNAISGGRSWNYLEVVDDADTRPQMYTPVAAVTDFTLCDTLKNALSLGGSLSALRVPQAIDDPRSVTFGVNHDSDPQINPGFPRCQTANRGDAQLANAYVLAREGGTPLILARDNLEVAYLSAGARFRSILRQRAAEGRPTRETVLAVGDSDTLLLMARGEEGFFVLNKAAARADLPVLDLTLSHLEGCYRELRNHFTVAIERRPNGRKYVSRWGSWARGGLEVQGRDALYFVRVPFSDCR